MLAFEIHQHGYRQVLSQNSISTIESGKRAVPNRMLSALLRALPELPARAEDSSIDQSGSVSTQRQALAS